MNIKKSVQRYKWLYVMLIPGVVYYLVFKFGPMFGLLAAFKDYQPMRGFFGSPWVGMKHFIRFFTGNSFWRILKNTLVISGLNLIFYFPAPILIALLLNEVRVKWFKTAVQSVLYVPHFLSWVVITGISYALLTTDGGVLNNVIADMTGGKTVNFLGSEKWLYPLVVFQNVWKESGWGTIIFMAALAGIDIEMYEAAKLDGANRLQQIMYITLPAIRSTIITMLILRLGKVMETGFDQLLLMQNPMNRNVAEVIDTYVYSMGMKNGQLSFATAVGLFKSVIGLILVLASDRAAKKVGDEGLL
ncbi:MAG: sugar ABC transporter permease [Hungatella sp.]|jgi:putative aldouronate transport system permease protein|nr:sugar ABC transporter permease [Hungatella sp.]